MDYVVQALRALGEPTRLRIVNLVRRGELTVSELVQVLGQSQPRVSRHLKLLSEAGLVERMPEGAWVFYRIADHDDALTAIVRAAIDAVSAHDATWRRDHERLNHVRAERAHVAATYFSDVAAEWDHIRALHTEDTEVERVMVEALSLPAPHTHVDVGTGTGRVLEVFAPRVQRAIGVDLSHEMLTVARANLEAAGVSNVSVRHGDLYALPFSPQCADLVTIHQVLHYLDDPGRALLEAGRLVRAGGQLILVDFAPHDLEFLRERHAHRRLGFDDADVAGWLAQAGLTPGAVHTLAPHDGEALGAMDGARDAQAARGLVVKVWSARRDYQTASLSSFVKGDAA